MLSHPTQSLLLWDKHAPFLSSLTPVRQPNPLPFLQLYQTELAVFLLFHMPKGKHNCCCELMRAEQYRAMTPGIANP